MPSWCYHGCCLPRMSRFVHIQLSSTLKSRLCFEFRYLTKDSFFFHSRFAGGKDLSRNDAGWQGKPSLKSMECRLVRAGPAARHADELAAASCRTLLRTLEADASFCECKCTISALRPGYPLDLPSKTHPRRVANIGSARASVRMRVSCPSGCSFVRRSSAKLGRQ